MSERLTWQRGLSGEDGQSADRSAGSSTSSKPVDAKSGKGEKPFEKVGFLYNKQELDREAYLTGKKVDKNFTAYLENEKNAFEASLDPHKNTSKSEFDLGRKVREDPLALVKEKENERFKKLQANPQKMARMKKLMMAYLGNNEEEEESDDSDSDKKKRRRSREESSRSHRSRRSRSRERRRSRSRERRRSRERKRRSRSRSRSKERREKKDTKPGYGLILPAGAREARQGKDEKYESKFARYKKEPVGYERKEKHGFTKKLSAEEKAKRLAAMSGNAEWREETRKARVKKGRQEDEKEEKETKTDDHSYYRKMKMAATDKSLEERVKARSSANQKTAAALDKNWTKR